MNRKMTNYRIAWQSMKCVMTDIPAYPTFARIEPLDKGYSGDKKYRMETRGGEHLLLRVSDVAEYDRKRAEFDMLSRVAELGVPASRPVDFGVCDGGKSVFQLLTWIDGEDLDVVLPAMSETEQYTAGLKAGRILRQLHSIPAPDNLANWSERYFAVIDERLDAYRAEGAPFEGSGVMLSFLENNRGLLKNRPQCRHHGDYHEGNLIISADKEISVIDWHNVDFDGYGDPWYELGRCFSDIQYYAVGEIHGYFDGDPPEAFWRLFAYYGAVSAITSIVWAKYNAPCKLAMKLQANLDVLNWFDNFNRVAPTWYVQYSHIHIQYIDGVPFKLKAPFDFSFLRKYGEVFKVFDGQDSGNICFGVANGAKRYFVKFAGAPTSAYTGAVESAIERLKAAVPLYLELAHPALIRFVSAEEIGGGYAMVFDWVDAICAHRMYPADYKAFGQLPLDVKRRIFEDIMEFHAYITEKGYIAVDLYDGSVMYDLTNGRTVICDIDFFVKANYIYNIGPLWGCTRFMAPEDFQTGAVINEVTNVYGLGAMAFALFADSDRSPEAWPLTQELYAVVRRATSDERAERQQSIRQLIDEWKAAEQSMFNPAPGRALR